MSVDIDFPVEVDFVGPLDLAGTVGVDVIGPVELAGIPDTFNLKIAKISLGIDPVDVSVRIKEIPSIRAHVPANFTVGFSVLGLQLFCIRLCGEAQVITEPYIPNPCERCD